MPTSHAALEGAHDDVALPAGIADDDRRPVPQQIVQQADHRETGVAIGLRSSDDLPLQIGEVIEQIAAMRIDDLNVRTIKVYPSDRAWVVADRRSLTEQPKRLDQEIVEVRRDDAIRELPRAQEMCETQVGQ